MDPKKQKTANKYVQEMKHLFPVIWQSEKRFLTDIRQNIDEYCQEKDDITYDTLVHVFGEPKDLIANYITEKDAVVLQKEIRTSKHIKCAICTIVSIIIFLAGFKCYAIYSDYQNAQKAQINQKTIIIEEETK